MKSIIKPAPFFYPRAYDGTPVYSSTDLSSGGFGAEWGHSRSWAGTNNASLNGNGWSIMELPYVVLGGGTQGAVSPSGGIGTGTARVTRAWSAVWCDSCPPGPTVDGPTSDLVWAASCTRGPVWAGYNPHRTPSGTPPDSGRDQK